MSIFGFAQTLNFISFAQEAEELHKRAIKIKSDLLGPFDYEVGLSIGHLASLYSYHMKKYREAEKLYLKSIAISEYPKKIVLMLFSGVWITIPIK